jgi:hypothetical protein
MDGSTTILAWYSCRRCGEFWSARIRDGRPVVEPGEWPRQGKADLDPVKGLSPLAEPG